MINFHQIHAAAISMSVPVIAVITIAIAIIASRLSFAFGFVVVSKSSVKLIQFVLFFVSSNPHIVLFTRQRSPQQVQQSVSE